MHGRISEPRQQPCGDVSGSGTSNCTAAIHEQPRIAIVSVHWTDEYGRTERCRFQKRVQTSAVKSSANISCIGQRIDVTEDSVLIDENYVSVARRIL